MAKRRRENPAESKASATEIELRKFYEMGTEANAASGEYGAKVNERIADKHGVSASNVGHACRFADLVDRDELEEICKLRNQKGKAFGPGMATTLFRLKTKKDRRWLLRIWAAGASARDLKLKIKEKFGTGPSGSGGRKSRQPSTRSEAVRSLYDRCSNWLSWYDQFVDDDLGETSIRVLPAKVQKELAATMRAVEKLQKLTMDCK